jgi:hypothetical protein
MKYDDLYKFPEGHPPSPYDEPVWVLSRGDVYLPADLELVAVGWIEEPDFPTGEVPDEVIEALVAAYPGKIVSDGTRGIHTCTLCHETLPKVDWDGKQIEVEGYGHYLVRQENTVYMAPALLLHYIIDHDYLPPQVFLDAVLNGEFMTADDLVAR